MKSRYLSTLWLRGSVRVVMHLYSENCFTLRPKTDSSPPKFHAYYTTIFNYRMPIVLLIGISYFFVGES